MLTKTRIEEISAKIISGLGHPIILGSIAALYVNFTQFPQKTALKLSLQLFGLCIIPLISYILFEIRRGNFKDFDVSEQEKRGKLYMVLFVILLIQCFFVFYNDFGWIIISGAITVLLMVAVFLIVNRFLKISLHTSFAFLLATMAIKIEVSLAFTLYLFALLILLSRLILKRHTVPEVAFASLGGLIFGGIFHLITH